MYTCTYVYVHVYSETCWSGRLRIRTPAWSTHLVMVPNGVLSYKLTWKSRHHDNQDTYDQSQDVHNTKVPLYSYIIIIAICICSYASMFMCMHIAMYACMYHMYVCMYVCMYLCMCVYVCMYVCICSYICMYMVQLNLN